MHKDIFFNNRHIIGYSFMYSMLIILSSIIAIYFVFKLPILLIKATGLFSKLVVLAIGIFLIVGLLFVVVSGLIDVVACFRLSGLTIRLRNNCLILDKGEEEYHINREDSQVVYCMAGWLLSWSSDGKKNVLLLRKGFLGKHAKDFSLYSKSCMNFFNSKQESKRILNSMSINIHNPLNYIQWPVAQIGIS